MRKIAIHTGADTYLDHLGVLAILLNTPLILTEEKTYEIAKVFYPELDVILKSPLELSVEYLAREFDAIFESGHTWAFELIPIFKLLFHKNMRVVYCPHGNSDKGNTQKNHLPKDISLVYGKQMIDLLARTGQQASSLVETGNYRLPFYRQRQKFYDTLVRERIPIDSNKKTILYAPTWADGENNSSFFHSNIETLSKQFNLLIKLHPFLERDHPAETDRIIAKYKNAIFITDFPAIYPLLSLADAYLGDFSSISYDFLAFDKPMFFLGTTFHDCGVQIPPDVEISRFIEENWNQKLFSKARRELYDYAFGQERDVGNIKEDLEKALSNDRAFVI